MAFKVNMLQQVKESLSIADIAEEYLTVRTKKNGVPYQCNCVVCGSGEHHDGALTIYPENGTCHCFACGWTGDALDLIGAINGTASLSEELTLANKLFGVDIDGIKSANFEARMNFAFERKRRDMERKRKAAEEEQRWSINRPREAEWLQSCSKALNNAEALGYIASRGISLEVAKRWNLGYNQATKRLVIPYPGSEYYHADRDITGHQEPKYKKPCVDTLGHEPLWNPSALDADAFVVCEGQLDALAIIDAGFASVACGGTGFKRLLKELSNRGGYSGKVALMFDNPALDEAGSTASNKACKELQELGITPCIIANYPEGIKDPFEWWQRDKIGMASAIGEVVRR